MTEDQTKDDFADFFDWKNIVESDAFLTENRGDKVEKDNALELSKRLSLMTKPEQKEESEVKEEKPILHKGLQYSFV